MFDNINNELETLYKLINNNVCHKCDTIECLNDTVSRFDTYTDIINQMLDSKDCNIEDIFVSVVTDDKFPYNKITITDITQSRNDFFEYFDGFCDYISKYMMLNDTYNIDKSAIDNKSIQATMANSKFMDTLFENKIDVLLKEACGSLNTIIGTIDDIDIIKTKFKSLYDIAARHDSSAYSKQVKDALSIYVNLVNAYLYKMISASIDTYQSILTSMKTRTGAMQTIVPEFQIF